MDKNRAKKALAIAAKRLSKNDYVGAKHFLNNAQNLYPELDGLKQVSTMITIYISTLNGGNEGDWYGVLGVDPMADEEVIKKQYEKLALLLHPDKNRFRGAQCIFKVMSYAWTLLSDRAQRVLYDERRMRPLPRMNLSASNYKNAAEKLSNQFWTKCNECKTRCEYWRDSYLNKTVLCPLCGKSFIATEHYNPAFNAYI